MIDWVNRVHSIGRNRSIITAQLPADCDINYIMSRFKTLQSTGYIVHCDYPHELRERWSCLARMRAESEWVAGRRRMPLVYNHPQSQRAADSPGTGSFQRGGRTVLRRIVRQRFLSFPSQAQRICKVITIIHVSSKQPTATASGAVLYRPLELFTGEAESFQHWLKAVPRMRDKLQGRNDVEGDSCILNGLGTSCAQDKQLKTAEIT